MATNLESKISRIATNVMAALNAIAEKGVDISGADSDDLAKLIESISQAEDLTAVLDEQETLIETLQAILDTKASGGGSGESVEALAEEIRTLTGNPYLTNEELQEQLSIFNQVPQSVSRKIYCDFNKAATELNPSAKLLVFGEETGYDDVVHDAAMINIFTGSNEGIVNYFENIYTVVEDCTLMVIGAINNFETSQSLSQGSVMVNGTTVDSYTATSNKIYSYTLGTPYVFDAVAGDTIKFRTPSGNGWPKQYGCIYKV